jgi:Amt family ammonium transporter
MNQADTAWMLISTALVLLMTRFTMGVSCGQGCTHHDDEAIAWLRGRGLAHRYSLALAGQRLLGDASFFFLKGVDLSEKGAIVPLTIPHALYMAFQATFCIITAALISGAIVERMRFSAYVVFITIWSIVVYAPLAHWVWGGGFLADLGAWDFAGGTVVHVNAASAALVAVIALGKRQGYPSRRCCRTACRSCSSAPACSGSAGSGSTPAAPWRPARLPAWRS